MSYLLLYGIILSVLGLATYSLPKAKPKKVSNSPCLLSFADVSISFEAGSRSRRMCLYIHT